MGVFEPFNVCWGLGGFYVRKMYLVMATIHMINTVFNVFLKNKFGIKIKSS